MVAIREVRQAGFKYGGKQVLISSLNLTLKSDKSSTCRSEDSRMPNFLLITTCSSCPVEIVTLQAVLLISRSNGV